VLVVAPHPDDEIGCGGTILLHVAARDEVAVLHVTDGRRSRALGLDPDAMAARRRGEARASLTVLGVTRQEWLGLPEGNWADEQLVGPLERLLEQIAPHVIYAPSRVDFHPEHHRVARLVARVLEGQANAATTVRAYPIQVPLTRTLANLVSPIGAVVPTLLSARDCHASQEGSLRAAMRIKHYAGRAHHSAAPLEEFWEMSPAGFVALHAPEPAEPAKALFRGLRRLALADGLAFTRGQAERRRLRALVHSVR
jgi:LmbE family N-acetylglucosaminyl deacetylase